MKSTQTLTLTSHLNANSSEVWRKVSTLKGVNAELSPLLRMTAPYGVEDLPFTQATLKQTLFGSWLLLFGVLPFDRHFLRLDEVWEGGFRENSSSLMHRNWRHERIIASNNEGSTITDNIEFETRIPLLGFLLLPVIRLVFQHRHRHLRQWFNRAP